MKIKNCEGEYAFKCLFSPKNGNGWDLSQRYFFSYDEARRRYDNGFEIKWPVEVYDDGTVYIPSPEELNA